jgi:hypothetical protein
VLAIQAPNVPVLNLVSNAPAADPRRAAYLLAALAEELPEASVVLGIVDPGVGGGRLPVVLEASGRRYVGPDNGLFSRAVARDPAARAWRIDWRPGRLSASFHGRDLFAPVAARLATGAPVPLTEVPVGSLVGGDWPDEIAEVIYADAYGNLYTGLRGDRVADSAVVELGGCSARRGSTFSAVPAGELFWYRNSCGLVEVAANGASARDRLRLGTGAAVRVLEGPAAADSQPLANAGAR